MTPTHNSRDPERLAGQARALGEHVRAARLALGLTLREVEARTSKAVTNGYLSQIEKGAIGQPSPNVLYHLAEVYDLDYRDLLKRAGHHVPAASSKRESASRREADNLLGIPLRAIQELDEAERKELTEYIAFLRQRRESRGDAT